jgi:homoserine dehydrogenase
MESRPVRIGIIGAGFVGSALAELLSDSSRAQALADAATAPVELVGVAVRDASRTRPGVPSDLVTDDFDELLSRDLDVLVEVVGGIEPAKGFIERALRAKVSVVTANKALLAAHGYELSQLANENSVDLFYEAAVAGGIPILRALRSSLAGEQILRVMGIVNGTTNFILSKMSNEGLDYADVLAQAQALGFAEADPTADVEGFDPAAKIAILSSLAFGTKLEGDEIAREGISGIRSVDVEFARRSGYVIKLLGIAERIGDSGLSRRVHPTLVPKEHPLASVNGAMNAVFVDGAKSGPLMWLGQGAGGEPTATAVLGDVLDAARNRVSDRHDIPFTYDNRLHFVDEGELRSAFYISIDVDDEPGVLAAVANIFAEQGVSILSMEQSGEGAEARMSFVTHEARTESVRATIHALSDLPKVERVGACLRVLAGGL